MTRRNRPGAGNRDQKDHNPARPLTAIEQEFIDYSKKEIQARQSDGSVKTVSALEALIHQSFKSALSGGSHSMTQVSRALRAAEERQARYIEDQIELGHKIKASQERELQAYKQKARKEGHSEEEVKELANRFLPHPDDTIISEAGYKLTAPFDEEGLKHVLRNVELRDAFLLQHELDERFPLEDQAEGMEWLDEDHVMLFGNAYPATALQNRSSYIFAMDLNENLPTRFQLTESDIWLAQHRFRRLTKRDLLRECYQTWRRLGIKRERGWVSPPLKEGIMLLRFSINVAVELTNVIRSNNKKPPSIKENMDLIQSIWRETQEQM